MIYLVRHAHAGDKHAWEHPDQLRPLSASGYDEACGLLTRLGGFPVTAIVSSPAVRCVQTVEELAYHRALPVSRDARLGRDAGTEDALALLLEHEHGNVVLCTHGEVIGALLAELRRRGAPVPADAEWPKASTWLLDVSGAGVTDAVYLPPLRTRRPEVTVS